MLSGPSAILFDPSKFPASTLPPLSLYLDPQNLVQIQIHRAPLNITAHKWTALMKHELGTHWRKVEEKLGFVFKLKKQNRKSNNENSK